MSPHLVYGYTTHCLLDYLCFKEHYEQIAIEFSKQEKLDTDPKAKQKINFTGKPGKNATKFWLSGFFLTRKKQF